MEKDEGLSLLSAGRIKSGPVVDDEQLRLFLVGWDVITFCDRPPVLPGVHP